ncbi:MAG: 16S rRNA (cytosine(967)-C(5))-methyltransferase RsmB [Planctomyces sp.]|nr:16S rRNA (cytosine(967)-C(5))-methyltransferase RsmB [Planctomyces sp.]
MKPRPDYFSDDRPPRRRPAKKRPPRKSATERRSERASKPDRPRQDRPTLVPRTARQLAFYLLQEGDLLGERERGGQPPLFATERLESAFTEFALSPEDRRLAQELLNGTIRRKGTLDILLSDCCQRPLKELELELVWLMRLGAYQLVYLDAIPDHAAVNETVDVARWYDKQRWCQFLNGNLRSVSRLLAATEVIGPATDTLPTRDGHFRSLTKPLFADPRHEPQRYLSETQSFPGWLLDRWSKQYDFDELARLCQWFNAPAPLFLRVNSRKTNRNELLSQFEQAEVAAEAGSLDNSIRMRKSYAIRNLPGFDEGLFTVQDETPQRVCSLLNAQPGEAVWDMCAAPGTKSTCLAEAMNNQGTLLATDINATRLKRVQENARRLELSIIKTDVLPDNPPYAIRVQFDAILIDAPCSNTGVLGKRSEARWRLRSDDINELARIQRHLLGAALTFLKPGGRIVYATCSIEPEENELQVRQFLQGHRDLELQSEEKFTPGQPADGGYAALITRRTDS